MTSSNGLVTALDFEKTSTFDGPLAHLTLAFLALFPLFLDNAPPPYVLCVKFCMAHNFEGKVNLKKVNPSPHIQYVLFVF